MKQRDFFDAAHAHQYLVGSVVRRNERPIMIEGLADLHNDQDGYQIQYKYVGDGEDDKQEMVTFLKIDDRVDFTPMPLGMCAYKSKNRKRLKTFYLSRYPQRMWKVGLNLQNLRVDQVVPDLDYLVPPHQLILWSSNFEKMVTGKYETYDEAYRLSSISPDNEIPVSRRFAISNNKIFYKALQVPVGECGKHLLTLYDKFHFLHESLKEDLPDAY